MGKQKSVTLFLIPSALSSQILIPLAYMPEKATHHHTTFGCNTRPLGRHPVRPAHSDTWLVNSSSFPWPSFILFVTWTAHLFKLQSWCHAAHTLFSTPRFPGPWSGSASRPLQLCTDGGLHGRPLLFTITSLASSVRGVVMSWGGI